MDGNFKNSNSNRKRHPSADLSLKAAVCSTGVKRTFVFTFILTLVAMVTMYCSSGKLLTLTLEKYTRSNNSYPPMLSRPVPENNTATGVLKHNKSNLMSVKSSDETLKYTVNFSNSVVPGKELNGDVEFPGMPDPCAKPRRWTGVEDLLCMPRPRYLASYRNPCWQDGGRLRCLPYFHLFGVCKSGTSDLFKRIYLHPQIVPNKGIFGKETWYWSWKRFETKNLGGILKLGMTLREFTDMFYADRIRDGVSPDGFHRLVTGHGDPMDFWDRFADEMMPQNNPGAEELLWTTPFSVRHINPNVKLLLMVRDPIDRLYSHYFHSGAGTTAQSFDQHIRVSIPIWKQCLQNHSVRSCIYNPELKKQLKAPIYTSIYVVHLREWLKAFPREQMLIMRNEDYTKHMRGTLKSVFQFLDVEPPSDSLLDQMVNLPHFYETKAKARAGPMLPSTRQLLVDLYRPYTEELAIVLGDDRFAFRDTHFG